VDIRDQRAEIAADIALGVGFALAVVVTAVALGASWGGTSWLFDAVAAAVVCGIALLRRRRPGWAALAGLVVAAIAILIARSARLPTEPGPAMALALAVLVGAAVRVVPARAAAALAAAGLALVAGVRLAALPSSAGSVAVTALNGTAWLAALGVGLGLRYLDARHRALTERVRQDERLELARELHDVVAHHITGIVVQAQAAQLVVGRHPEKLDGAFAGIEAAGSDALAAMRRVVGLLRDADDAAPATPGPERLSELVERFDRDGPTVALSTPEDDPAWPPEVTSTVYRVVQESLTNISRHAPHAKSVTVSVEPHDVGGDRGTVTVEVVDDAAQVAGRYRGRAGYGLIGMRERVETLGGTLRAGPRPGAGWSVVATLPVPR
jgi:signal transduction histidine kinase